jgi:hypothetical protein
VFPEDNDHYSGNPEQLESDDAQSNDWACPSCQCSFPRPIAISFKEFCRLTSLGRTTAWALARDKKIEVRRVGGRAVVLTRSIDTLLDLSNRERRA